MKGQEKSKYYCQLHHESIIIIDASKSKFLKESKLCQTCIDNLDKKLILDDFDDQSNKIKSAAQQERLRASDKLIVILEKLTFDIEEYQLLFIQTLNQVMNKLKQWIKQISYYRENIVSFIKSINTIFLGEFRSELSKLDKQCILIYDFHKKGLQDQLQQMLSNRTSNFENIISGINCEDIVLTEDAKQPAENSNIDIVIGNKEIKKCDFICLEHSREAQILNINKYIARKNYTGCIYCGYNLEWKPLYYQQLVENSITLNEWCIAMAFNKQSTLMVAGLQSGQIIVFQFSQGGLEQGQVLSDHTSCVYTLYFMKQQNQFVSGSCDKSIRIWGVNNCQQWYCQQLLKEGHTGRVNLVIMNKSEDLIISCSYDASIKFWVKKNEWQLSQTLSAHTNDVCSICLNEADNLLVSCAFNTAQILISAVNYDKEVWEVKQQITVDQWGQRVSFIGNTLIAFQPYNGVKMETFKLNEQNNQFAKSTEVNIEKSSSCFWFFPQQYNIQKSILLSKNGDRVNLFRKKNHEEFVLEQSIRFGHYQLWGAMTDDGEYLVTWDASSYQLQVRKQQ